jgi:hypothetical protein
MASTSFKIPCPSCEAGVLVKDESLVGKKIDCPKCKYRFVVEAPNGKDKGTATRKAAPPAGKTKPDVKAPPAKTKPGAKVPKEEPADEEDRPKKGLASNKKMLLLAGAGVLVLLIGGFLVLNKFVFGKKPEIRKPPNIVNQQPPKVPDSTTDPSTANEDPETVKKKKDQTPKPSPRPQPVALSPAGPGLTSLLPAQAQHVTHVFVRETLDLAPLLASAAYRSGPFADEIFKEKLGFPLKSVDDLIRAESYRDSWTFTVVHLTEGVNVEDLKGRLGLEPAPGSPANGRDFFQVTKNAAWLEQLGRMSVGTQAPPTTSKEKERPLFLRIHDPQTLVFADAAPMTEYLGRTAPPSEDSYATLKNTAMKAMLDKMEKLPPDSPDRVLVSSVTDLESARMPSPSGRVQWRFRPLWDVAYALTDYAQRLKLLGTVLLRRGKEPVTYRYQNEIECVNDTDLRTIEKDLREKVAPDVSRFLELLLGLKVAVADSEGNDQATSPMNPAATNPPPPPPPIGRPPPGGRQVGPPGGRRPGGRPPAMGGRPPVVQNPNPPPMANAPKEPVKVNDGVTHIVVAGNDKSVVFTLHVVLDDKSLPNLVRMADLMMLGLRGQLEVASGLGHRNSLARAVKKLGEQPGGFPPGLLPRKDASWTARDPEQRISWMAGLLPYLGQETLYNQYIKKDASWKDRANWMAAGTIIPEFLDPSYPEWARRAAYPGVPFPLAGTHYVGIGGVGRGAAEYSADNPLAGVFGYDRATSLEEIRKNRGLAHTAVMVQVPYDGPAGITPWMAGGGSTIRGVPETDSVKPFVSTKLNGKSGTYLLMADGSVRFVGADVKDEVFKAFCTIKGPADVANLDREAPAVKAK